MTNVWVYFLGEKTGEDIKIGYTAEPLLASRLRTVQRDQTTSAEYRVLAAVVGTPKDERACKAYFASHRRKDKGSRTEYFHPADELVEYVNWLRAQWWVDPEGTIPIAEMPCEDPAHWLPDPGRRISPPAIDAELLVQPYQQLNGPLAGTAWDWMVSIKAQVQDYFTPPEIVDAARQAMGGIDLDAASHWLANRTLRIPDYFHTGRNAFENEWYGRVWLNPPYGHNAPWFDAIEHYVVDTGSIEQICMLSPMWAFQTRQARPVMRLASAVVLLTPTPVFWGNSEGKTGKNHPHGIIYIGSRTTEFAHAFARFGILVKIVETDEEFVPVDEVVMA